MDGGRTQSVMNYQIIDTCRLCNGEAHKFMFHPGNIKRLTKPKKKNGNMMCLRFHYSGYCFKYYHLTNGHGTIDTEGVIDQARFLTECKEHRKKFLERRGTGGQNRAPRDGNDELPATTAAVVVAAAAEVAAAALTKGH